MACRPWPQASSRASAGGRTAQRRSIPSTSAGVRSRSTSSYTARYDSPNQVRHHSGSSCTTFYIRACEPQRRAAFARQALHFDFRGSPHGGGSVSQAPGQANVVVIGAGIVGNSIAYHLARLGWKDIVLVDKGPLPNPGGSTGHASNFIFLTDHSKEMTLFTLDSVRQYKELGVFTQSGGVEVARTTERMDELKRRMASSKAWGIDAELVSPAEVKRLVPFINEKIILGGFSTPGIGTVDSLRGGTLMREKAQAMGALSVVASTEVTAIDVENGRVRRVRTDKGDIETETVVITSGIWSPRLARMAGASIPLSPAVHQMISVGPVPLFADTVGEI